MGDPYQYEINHMEKSRLIDDAFELVGFAQNATTREHWAALSARFDEQMEDWKEIGSGDGARTRWKDNDEDEALWENFSSYRDEFRELRDEWFDNERARKQQERQPAYRQAAEAKQTLVSRIAGLADTEPFEADKAAELLFAEWKKIGHAGDQEAGLWSAFNAGRRSIKDKKKAIIDGRKAKLESALSRKQEIIKEAAKLCESSDWNLVSQRQKELHQSWKAAGGTGKMENALWDEFRGWLDKSKARRAAIQRGDPDPFPPPVAVPPPPEATSRVQPPLQDGASIGAAGLSSVPAPPAQGSESIESKPRRGRLPIYLTLCLVTGVLVSIAARSRVETPQTVAEHVPANPATAVMQAPPQKLDSSPERNLSCSDFQASRARLGEPYKVGCNNKTATGYYWDVRMPRVRPYGFWGMRGVGAVPSCGSPTDIGRKAETAVFKTASAVWEVRGYWCRQSEQHKDCHGRRDEGPVFNAGLSSEGVFAVVCRKQLP